MHRPWRKVKVTERRAAEDYVQCMRELVDVHYPDADYIRVVQDNLSTHTAGALYETFPPAEARRILRRLKFHYTPADTSFWWSAGGKVPILVIQGLQDLLAPPGNAHLLKNEFPTRVTLVELDRAAHALLPEQPDAIAAAVLTYLGDPRIK